MCQIAALLQDPRLPLMATNDQSDRDRKWSATKATPVYLAPSRLLHPQLRASNPVTAGRLLFTQCGLSSLWRDGLFRLIPKRHRVLKNRGINSRCPISPVSSGPRPIVKARGRNRGPMPIVLPLLAIGRGHLRNPRLCGDRLMEFVACDGVGDLWSVGCRFR